MEKKNPKNHPYRTPEEPILIASKAGLDRVKDSLEKLVSRIEKTDLTLSGLVESVAISGGLTALAFTGGPEAAIIWGMLIAKCSSSGDISSSRPARAIIRLCQEVFDYNIKPYERRLQQMLMDCNVSYDSLNGVPAEYVQPILLDYTISQYNASHIDRPNECIRFDEAIKASTMMGMQSLAEFVDYLIEQEDYDTLFRIKSASPYNDAVSLITEKAVDHFDDILDSGDEEGMYVAAQCFADFGYWSGLREMYSFLLDEGEEYSPEYVAQSIRPVTGEDERMGFSAYAVWELFDVLIDRGLLDRAEELAPLISLEDQTLFYFELRWARSRESEHERYRKNKPPVLEGTATQVPDHVKDNADSSLGAIRALKGAVLRSS